MGAGPSLGKFLKSMDDADLIELVENAYKLEPQRMDKIFALVKERYCEGPQQSRGIDDVESDTSLSLSSVLLPPTASDMSSSPPATPILNEMLQSTSEPVTSISITTNSCSNSSDAVTTTRSINRTPDASDDTSILTGIKDPMNALWTFKGHPLRELQAAGKNPQNTGNRALLHQGILHADHLGKNGGDIVDPSTGAILTPQGEVDTDGYPVIYGSCGRDKRYGRCSVCYFRGLRCNTAHYCACCQRSVCIRPRKYPGEEHHKICWNVLHMDKDMIQRVEKKKKRKLQALTAAATATASGAVSRLMNVETCNNEDADSGDSYRQNDSRSQSVVDLHRAPSIPTVVADVSGAVDL
ncbi:unnamed protein product [Peronospora farinosa]|uniref:Uncharacterized protein n=1 Tax=Peronospora farinosa TaxID=134698 RepID=A0AAV0T358_9STRA|nr:unnamed protein product [Peronospora farinosa]CAI5711036.1 unnamed protein product [Peronospora farinosa]